MPEIAINGQFNIDFPFQSGEGNIEIDRTSSALKTVPSNWSSFCDAVDAKLEPLAAAKATLKKVCTAFYLGIFVVVVGTQILVQTRFKESLPFGVNLFFPLIFFPTILAYLYFWCGARGTITRSMDDVQKLCGEYSGNGVTYELLNKHWGGCNKPHVRVYSILVTTDTDPENPSATVESSTENFSNNPPTSTNAPVAEPVYESSTPAWGAEPVLSSKNNDSDAYGSSTYNNNNNNNTSTSNGPSTSIFDQLKM